MENQQDHKTSSDKHEKGKQPIREMDLIMNGI